MLHRDAGHPLVLHYRPKQGCGACGYLTSCIESVTESLRFTEEDRPQVVRDSIRGRHVARGRLEDYFVPHFLTGYC